MTSFDLLKLESFGDVAAEDDAVLEYFLQTEAVENIQNPRTLIVLGRKGSGKTALVRYFTEGKATGISKALNLRQYPWQVHSSRKDLGSSPIESYVASWLYLLSVEFAALILKSSKDRDSREAKSIESFFHQNYGQFDVPLDQIIRPKRLQLSKASFAPSVMGVALGSIDLDRATGDQNLGVELNTLSNSLIEAAVRLAEINKIEKIILHLDELDHGLTSMDESRSNMIIGLIIAARTIFRKLLDRKINAKPVIYLRTDIFDELEFSDKNKINQTNALHLEWSQNSLLEMVNVRLRVRLGSAYAFKDICTESLMRGSQQKWNHITSRTFLRPRDVISFLNASLNVFKGRKGQGKIENKDIIEAREAYSKYLKEELDDEILPHWPHWERALQACSAISTITFTRHQFFQAYGSRRRGDSDKSAEEALELLYRFSVVGYGKRSGYGGSSWVFRYANPEAGWDNAASKFKVHIGLKEFAKLTEERRV